MGVKINMKNSNKSFMLHACPKNGFSLKLFALIKLKTWTLDYEGLT